ncbi:MAG TPA: type VI secretion system tip protein TssI/VgrG [Pyrinomonadaceae bacterium]
MPTKFTQENRRIQIFTPLGEDVLLLRGFEGSEGVSSLFRFDLRLLSENRSLAFDALVGKNATVKVSLADGSVRHINGICSRVSQGDTTSYAQEGTTGHLTEYRATLVPWLWLLTRTSDCRIFQNLSAPDIIQKVFQDYGFTDFSNRLHGSYDVREYCVQYRETAFDFVSRLMEYEGIFYFFEHEADKHTLVLADAPNEFKPCPNLPAAFYTSAIGEDAAREAVKEWQKVQEVRPGKYTANDFDFQKPALDLTASVEGRDTRHYEIYDYPGGYVTRDQGERLVGVRVQEQDSPLVVARGASSYAALASGYRVDLKGHYRRDMNGPYVLTSVQHSADLAAGYGSGAEGASEAIDGYSNTFECIPHPTPYRPPRVTPTPVIQGTQTAVIVGPAGEEIYTDKYGRVKVQFHWDREGKNDENSSCWVRVSQNWAGKRWGAMFVPRIGQEVIVDFLEGDPDRPIITGRLYNGGAMPPHALPDAKMKSTIKTYSTKGGGGFNEMSFDDTKGKEKVFHHAEKDLHGRVKNDRVEWIGRDTHLIVKRDQLEQVEGDKHLKVTGDQNEQVDGGYSLKVGQDAQTKAGTKFNVDAGQEIHLKAGMNVTIEAGTALTIKVGGNFININPGGIFIKGTMVMINSGGSGGSGSGASPTAPTAPLEADTGEPGQAHEMPPARQPGVPVVYSPAALVMRQAAQNGAPFCDI